MKHFTFKKDFVLGSFLLFLFVAMQACIYPEAPGRGTLRSTQSLNREKTVDWLEMAPYKKTVTVAAGRSTSTRTQKRSKNLLFIVADDVVGKKLQPELTRIYKKEVRLEEVLWWFYAPKIQKTYNYVLRIHWNGFNAKSLKASLQSMESMKLPYDVMILAHGIPNHLISSPGQGVISFRDLASLKGSLNYADNLYLQACFGDSLQKDFLSAGFRSVIAYEGLNWNFFYPDYFLDEMAQNKGNALKSHSQVVKHFKFKFKMSITDKEIVKRVFDDKPQEYLDNVSLPALYQ